MIFAHIKYQEGSSMAKISFTALHLAIGEQLPKDPKLLFKNVNCMAYKHNETDHQVTMRDMGDDMYWIYSQYGNQYPYAEEVFNTDNEETEKNPKKVVQVEQNHQLFGMYDYKMHEFYLTNTKKITFLETFFSEMVNEVVWLKRFLKTPDEFFSEVSSIQTVKLITKSDLFNEDGNKHSIEIEPKNVFGFGIPAQWELTASYDDKRPSKSFINKIKNLYSQKSDGSLQKLLCIGRDDKGIEKIFNLNSFTHKIEIDCDKEINGFYDENKVNALLKEKLMEYRRYA